jgi:hypothetical protein
VLFGTVVPEAQDHVRTQRKVTAGSAPGRWKDKEAAMFAKPLSRLQFSRFRRFYAMKLCGLVEELSHDLARTGDHGRYKLKRVKDQGQMLMINPAQVLVAGQKEPAIQQSRLG